MAASSPDVVRRDCQRSAAMEQSKNAVLNPAFSVAVVLPASGSGLRMGTPVPKQFWPIRDKPLLYYTLETFECIPWLSQIVVPASPDRLEWLEAQKEAWNLRKVVFVPGGDTRHRSIFEGVKFLASSASPPDVVIVHDAVRPFVEEETLRKVAEAAHEHGVAGTVLPLVSTIIKEKDGFLDHALDRSQYRASQTPQAFRLPLLLHAYQQATPHDFEHGTECLHLALTYSQCKARLIEGTANLFKVTYKPDIYAAEQMIKERYRQTAIVTGAGRGIGKEIARLLCARGMRVAVVARTEQEVLATCAESGPGAAPFVTDVSDPHQVSELFRKVSAMFGHIDAVVNNAGSAIRSRIEDLDYMEWCQQIHGNLTSTFLCSQQAMKIMGGSGRGGVIINIGSTSVQGGREEQGAYAASKAGIQAFTETLALEGKERGVYAYCVVPRRTATALRRQLVHTASPEEAAAAEEDCLKPENVAEVVVSLLLEASPWLTGQSFWVK